MGGVNGGGERATASSIADGPANAVAVFELLSNEAGRRLLSILYDRGGTVPVEELAEEVAASERVVTGDEVPVARHTRHRLRHVILPTLADTGVVTYDEATDAVTLADRGERLERYLAFVADVEPDDGYRR